jgi:ADP-heptose:LPS heptosyltransferase
VASTSSSRVAVRSRVLAHALGLRAVRGPRIRPAEVRRVLIAHHLLLGDTLMLAPLLAKLRERHPRAQLVMTVRPAFMPFFETRPYAVRAMPFDPRRGASLDALLQDRGYDLALVPGDNRYSWLAAALDAAWVVAFAGDRPAHKSWMVDELLPYPDTPMALADMNALLLEGPTPRPYTKSDWPAPPAAAFTAPSGRYAICHVGAGSPLRYWEPAKWRALAAELERRGHQVVWSAGPGEEQLVAQIDPAKAHASYAGTLDLAQMWRLLSSASLLVTLDTGIAHLAKLTATPTVTLYGPGSATLFGRGEFWRDAPFREVTLADFPCRDQRTLFKRRIEWVRRCQRTLAECAAPRCMQGIGVEPVLAAISSLGR